MLAPLQQELLLRGYPAPLLDFDFVNGVYRQDAVGSNSAASNFITTSRASIGYADDTAGNWTSFLSNVARITNKGLLVEGARTNSLRNNSMQGAVVGAPGTLPTNWTSQYSANQGTLALSVVAFGTLKGIDYIDFRLAGTPAGAGILQIFPEAKTQIAAVSGQAWTASNFGCMPAGSITNINSVGLAVIEYTSGGVFVAQTAGTAGIYGINPSLFGTFKGIITRTLTGGTTAFVDSSFQITYAAAVATDITIRIGWPQIEQGTFASSPIRTTGAAATRTADVVTVTTPPTFGSAYTIFGKGTPNAPVAFTIDQTLLSVSDGTSDNHARLFRINTTATPGFRWQVGGVGNNATAADVWLANTSGRIAGSGIDSQQAVSFNGGAVGTLAQAGTPPLSAINIGTQIGGVVPWYGYVEHVALWSNTRLLNDLRRIAA